MNAKGETSCRVNPRKSKYGNEHLLRAFSGSEYKTRSSGVQRGQGPHNGFIFPRIFPHLKIDKLFLFCSHMVLIYEWVSILLGGDHKCNHTGQSSRYRIPYQKFVGTLCMQSLDTLSSYLMLATGQRHQTDIFYNPYFLHEEMEAHGIWILTL